MTSLADAVSGVAYRRDGGQQGRLRLWASDARSELPNGARQPRRIRRLHVRGVYFNHAPAPGFVDMQEHVLTVENGDITTAKRKISGRHDRWIITVSPDGDADVTITLPRTTKACSANSVVCAFGGDKLSNHTPTTVSGPVEDQQTEGADPGRD